MPRNCAAYLQHRWERVGHYFGWYFDNFYRHNRVCRCIRSILHRCRMWYRRTFDFTATGTGSGPVLWTRRRRGVREYELGEVGNDNSNSNSNTDNTDLTDVEEGSDDSYRVGQQRSNSQLNRQPSNLELNRQPSNLQLNRQPSNLQLNRQHSNLQLNRQQLDDNDRRVGGLPNRRAASCGPQVAIPLAQYRRLSPAAGSIEMLEVPPLPGDPNRTRRAIVVIPESSMN